MQRRTSRPWDVREKVVAVSNDNFNGSFVQMECKFVHGHTTLSTVPTPSLSPSQNSGLLPDFMSYCIHGPLTNRNCLQTTLFMPPWAAHGFMLLGHSCQQPSLS